MELARPLAAEPAGQTSPLTSLRLQRKLTVDQAAKRAALWPEQVEWLEEGKLYRFPGHDTAVLALLRYATALGIDHREARRLSGMPVEPPAPRQVGRWIAAGAAVAVFVAAVLVFAVGPGGNGPSAAKQLAATLPPPWKYGVDVLNGSGDINYTRQVASHVGGYGYTIKKVGRAATFGYPQTAVFFPPRCEAVAVRLAKQLGVETKPLPGGSGACQLYVIVGPARGPGE